MNDLVKALGSSLPAHLRGQGKTENVFQAAKGSGGYPVISIKGKVFHVTRGDDKVLVTKPDDEDEPASFLEVVIIDVNPHKSKVFYEGGYEEGSTAAPTCYSNDGIAPAADAEEKQSLKCATCPRNAWGSRITDSGKKGKECADSMRLAVAPAGQLNDPMLLRVPAASLKGLGNFGEQLAQRDVLPHHVVTKLAFDYDVAHPQLKFKATGFVDESQLDQINEVRGTEIVKLITGAVEELDGDSEAEAEAAPEPKPAPKKKAAVKKAAKPKPEPVEAEAESEQTPPKKEAVVEVEDFDEIAAGLDDLDFDD